MDVMDVVAREASSVETSPFGSVGVVHAGADLDAWWIWKDDEDLEPTRAVMDREDLLYIIKGSLKLELDGQESRIIDPGELFVIPAGTPFRGYRWPRDGEPCLFLAIAPAGATFTRL
jgi:mannose-6-phosphate isomerase-like protein (cupin superfamily)